MSRRNKAVPKFGKCSNELKAKAKELVLSWERKCLSVGRDKGHIQITGLNNNEDTKGSLAEVICGWIESHPDWETQWSGVLDRLDTCAFLQTGFNNFLPNLSWLFRVKGGVRGIDLVAEGKYDQCRIKPSTKKETV